MKLIKLNHKESKTVLKWAEIKDDVKKLRKFIKTEKFEGLYDKCFALAHCEVAEDHFRFFIVSPEFAGKGKMFKHDLIINPRIVGKDEKAVERVPEACMSFPHRKEKKLDRFYTITVEYQILMPVINRLQAMREEVFSIKAQIFQHEVDHMNAINIYGIKVIKE